MKSLIIGILMFMGLFAHATEHKIFINCSGYDPYEKQITIDIAAMWVPGNELNRILLTIEKGEPSSIARAVLKPYKPRSSKYKNFDRFQLSQNGHSTTSVLLPKWLPPQNSFRAYFYDQGHEGYGTIPLTCQR